MFLLLLHGVPRMALHDFEGFGGLASYSQDLATSQVSPLADPASIRLPGAEPGLHADLLVARGCSRYSPLLMRLPYMLRARRMRAVARSRSTTSPRPVRQTLGKDQGDRPALSWTQRHSLFGSVRAPAEAARTGHKASCPVMSSARPPVLLTWAVTVARP